MAAVAVGTAVMFNHPSRAWEAATVVSTEPSGALRLQLQGGEVVTTVLSPSSVFVPFNPQTMQWRGQDLLRLPELHSSLLMGSLRQRYVGEEYCTLMGDTIISVNPFKEQRAFRVENLPLYCAAVLGGERNVPPHPWALACRAYEALRQTQRPQSMVISGDSGSGKTETCKSLLSALAYVAGRSALSDQGSQMVELLHHANPILEAFGNAKTPRNDNSSRFGRWSRVYFDSAGRISGMRVEVLLLESNRALFCAPDERLFHIYYQLLSGAPEELKVKLRLRRPRDYRALRHGTLGRGPGCDDALDFAETVKSMNAVGIDDTAQDSIWRVLAAILHLSNVDFTENADTSAALTRDDAGLVRFVGDELFGLPDAVLTDFLLTQTSMVNGARVTRRLTPHKATERRDALCRHVYARLFAALLGRLLRPLHPPEGRGGGVWVGLLDVFGFEDLAVNGWEQLTINLANESLQQLFAHATFVEDAATLAAEGVRGGGDVAFRDGGPCLALIGELLRALDDVATLDREQRTHKAGGDRSAVSEADRTFLERVTAKFRPDFQKVAAKQSRSVLDRDTAPQGPQDCFLRGRLDDDCFVVRHYAADVKYKVADMAKKNTDALRESALAVFTESSSPFIRELVVGEDVPRSAEGKRTVASAYRAALGSLMEMLRESELHWVRCIRPNTKKVPSQWDGKLVLEQLVSAGVLEAVMHRQNNFPVRSRLEPFVERFGVAIRVSLRRLRRNRVDIREQARAILTDAKVESSKGQIGATRIFLTSDAASTLEIYRNNAVGGSVLVIEQHMRALISRMRREWRRWMFSAAVVRRRWRVRGQIRRATAMHYAELSQRINDRHAQERATMLSAALQERVNFDLEEGSERQALNTQARRERRPLFAAVMQNVIIVEGQAREMVARDEGSVRANFSNLLARSAAHAAQLVLQRHQRRLEEERQQRVNLFELACSRARDIEQSEANQREAILKIFEPIQNELRRAMREFAAWRGSLSAEVDTLNVSRNAEIARIRREEQRRILDAGVAWQVATPRGSAQDMMRLTVAGMSPAAAQGIVRQFYASGDSAAALERGTRSFEDYAASMRRDYFEHRRASEQSLRPRTKPRGPRSGPI